MRIFEIDFGTTREIIGYPRIVQELGISIEKFIKNKYYLKFETASRGSALVREDRRIRLGFRKRKKLEIEDIKEIRNKDQIIWALDRIINSTQYSESILRLTLKSDCLETLKDIKADFIDEEFAYRKYKFRSIKFEPKFELKQNYLNTVYANCLNVKYQDYIGIKGYSRHNVNFYVSCNEEIKYYNSTKKLAKFNVTNFLFNEKIIKISKNTIFDEINNTCEKIKKKGIFTDEDWNLLMLNRLIKKNI